MLCQSYRHSDQEAVHQRGVYDTNVREEKVDVHFYQPGSTVACFK